MVALNIPDEEFTSALIRYGLYVGAIFQIICLGAIIFLPSPKNMTAGSIWGFLKGEDETNSGSTSPQETPKKPLQRGRKPEKDKKKRH